MKLHRRISGRAKQSGFTLLELLLVLLILSIVIGAVFSQMSTAQRRLSAEEIRLDDFQQARDFVDQFFRDINQIGTPNMQIMDTSLLTPGSATSYTWANSFLNDSRMAIGLVKIKSDEIWFEGSMNGTGTVQTVIYKINGNGNCSLCMQRSQADKTNGDPLTTGAANANWGTEVNDIVTTGSPIFRYYQYDGTEVTSLPVDYTTQTNANTIASVKTIQINLTIRNPNVMDQQTGLPIETSFEGEVSLNNCSMAVSGQNMSCQ